ncbi:MAG: hypothetical protein IT175_08195 [Acidobacteria bacterium]|nr:hypothetical protein [Acidobacteriota bacterium]
MKDQHTMTGRNTRSAAISEVRDVEFRVRKSVYRGSSAVAVVRAIERDAVSYPDRGGAIRKFLCWSLDSLGATVPQRDLDLSASLEDEDLALSYLFLLDEYGAGEVLAPRLESRS